MTQRGRPRHPDILTPRQWEVLALLRERLTDQEIADRLGISLPGAKYHVSEILSKLGVSSREEAAALEPEEPRPAWRRFVALPLAAKVWSVAVVAAAIAGLGLLAWGVTATSNGQRNDAREVAEKAVAAMEALDSYRVTGNLWAQGPIDFQAPDRIVLYDGAGLDGPAAFLITIGTSDYSPLLTPDGERYWVRRSLGEKAFVGPPIGSWLPQWRHLALGLAANLEIVGITREDGNEFFHLRGSVNPYFAWLENQRRFHETTGIDWVLPACDDKEFVREESLEPDPQCWEEFLERQRAYEDFGTIEAWISSDTFLVHRTEIRAPGDFETEYVEVAKYSHFNEIEIEPPEDIRARPD